MNRRTFLRGFAGLAAVAVAGPTLAALSKTDRDRLVAQMQNNGVIEDQTFVIRDGKPIMLKDVHGLTIRRCRFIWTTPSDGPYIIVGKGCDYCTLDTCSFEGGASGGLEFNGDNCALNGGWEVGPQAGIDVEVETPHGIRWSRV